VSNSQTLSDSPWCTLGKIVSLNCPGKKRISGVGMPLIAVAKMIKKALLGTSHAIFECSAGYFQ